MMYLRWLAALGLSIAITSVAAPLLAASPEQVHIEDADTLLVEIEGVSYRIQLVGIDAPESSMNPKLQRDMERTGLSAEVLQALGLAADRRLRELLVEFHPYQLLFDPQRKDRYGRTPGDLIDAHGTLLSLRLVQEGYAIPVGPPAQQEKKLQEAANVARKTTRGLWLSHPDAVRAWATPRH